MLDTIHIAAAFETTPRSTQPNRGTIIRLEEILLAVNSIIISQRGSEEDQNSRYFGLANWELATQAVAKRKEATRAGLISMLEDPTLFLSLESDRSIGILWLTTLPRKLMDYLPNKEGRVCDHFPQPFSVPELVSVLEAVNCAKYISRFHNSEFEVFFEQHSRDLAIKMNVRGKIPEPTSESGVQEINDSGIVSFSGTASAV